VKELSQIIISEFQGDTKKIWTDHSSNYVKSVFSRIHGVGPGIASMIVLLLEKCFRIHFNDLDHRSMDVKPDVHVVRVFHRLGFIDLLDSEEALKAARKLCPDYPGSLDAPTWIIGKKWCSQFSPQCYACIMETICPKMKL
jgi:endonuclease III|tara:strand:- start:170 stop:592 length:423 start_codon:yes stop_codon:yes gene_type:complete